jgi:hypothetical protein
MDQCRHGECQELPTLHAEVVRQHDKPAVIWEGNFCSVHGNFSIMYWIKNLGHWDSLVVTEWDRKRHGSSREPGKVKRSGSIHEGEGDPS